MSDSDDRSVNELYTGLGAVYAMLITICGNLPIPVSLPTGIVTGDEAADAVRRVTELLTEIPLPDEQLSMLSAGATMWLCATDMLGLIHGGEFEKYRALGGTAMLVMAQEALLDLARWQNEQANGS
ncbi:hypothetical protein [Streptomyces liangshanensis]|uniref:hypothetical protein n=1 Tax=Streptomyces liangshanensis TaxID=2717324 RepID=UPI0036D92D14